MNKTLFVAPILILYLLAPSACQAEKSTTVATTTSPTSTVSTVNSPDQAFFTGSQWAYAAYLTSGETPFPTVSVTLGAGTNIASITYRNNIETSAGETRYDIINVSIDNLNNIQVTSTINGLPAGITSKNGIPVTGQQLIEFDIPPSVKTGKYDFKIDININGTDYGTIPCTINVS